MQLRGLERWISILRMIAFPFVFAIVALADYPPGRWQTGAWVTTAVFGIGTLAFFWLARRGWEPAIRSSRASPPRCSTHSS